jgi:hypothetical protein
MYWAAKCEAAVMANLLLKEGTTWLRPGVAVNTVPQVLSSAGGQ